MTINTLVKHVRIHCIFERGAHLNQVQIEEQKPTLNTLSPGGFIKSAMFEKRQP